MDKQFIRLLGLRSLEGTTTLLSVNTMPNNTKSKGKVGVHFGALRRDISLPRYRFLETGLEKNTNFQLSENDGIQKLWILNLIGSRNFIVRRERYKIRKDARKVGKEGGEGEVEEGGSISLERWGTALEVTVIRTVGGSEIRLKGSVGREYGGINPVFRFIIGRAYRQFVLGERSPRLEVVRNV